MDLNKIVERAKNILLLPKTEWPAISAEPGSIGGIYKNYLLVLAAIPAVFGLIDATVFGTSVPFLGTYRIGFGAALQQTLLVYALTLAGIFVFSLIVNALAPTFGGTKDSLQAFKVVAYSATAGLVAGVAQVVPFLGGLITLAAGIYGIYLLYLGLPVTMKCPPEKAGAYTAVSIVVSLVVSLVFWGIAGRIIFGGVMMSGAVPGLPDSSASDSVNIDPDSPLGKLEQMGKRMEEANARLEEAQKSGDAKAQSEALGAVLGAALGGGGKVEALAPERLKPFLPESLAGRPRKSFSTERNGALGMQVSEGKASYADAQGRELRLEITDLGGAQGVMMLAGWASLESEKQTETGYEKTRRENGRIVHEEWDDSRKSGEYSIVLAERFLAKVSGDAADIGELKAALGAVDLAGLEALKGEGVQASN